jgi:predicted HicB family RNase H-like nuclease
VRDAGFWYEGYFIAPHYDSLTGEWMGRVVNANVPGEARAYDFDDLEQACRAHVDEYLRQCRAKGTPLPG